jgi:hypothetical protein
MKKTGPFAVRVHTAKDFWSLCRVHTHGKGATWRPVDLGGPGGCAAKHFAVRGGARQSVRTAQSSRTYEAKLISPIHDLIFRKQTQEICTPSGIFNFQTKIT